MRPRVLITHSSEDHEARECTEPRAEGANVECRRCGEGKFPSPQSPDG